MLPALRIGTAAVWITFGLVCKVLRFVPRHEQIVAAVLGPAVAGPVTLAVGLAEIALGVWLLTGRAPLACAAVQTAAIAAMNALELSFARDHLLAPVPMVVANVGFLALGWYLAVQTHRARAPQVRR